MQSPSSWVELNTTSDDPYAELDVTKAHTLSAQIITTISICVIGMMPILVFLQTKFQIGCWTDFKQHQMTHCSGRVLLIIFVISLCLSLIECSLYTFVVFSTPNTLIAANAYRWTLLERSIYHTIQWCTSLFFTLRLHFVFHQMPNLRVSPWILVTLMLLLTVSSFLSFMGTLAVLYGISDPSMWRTTASYCINMFVNMVVMILYSRGLMTVVIDCAKIESSGMVPVAQIEDDSSSENEEGGHHHIIHSDTGYATQSTSTTNTISAISTGSTNAASISSSTAPSSRTVSRTSSTSKGKVTVDENMIYLITKSTVLSLIGMLSSCVVICYLIWIIAKYGHYEGLFLGSPLRCLDGVINVICMYLVFRFNVVYYRIGCKGCHHGMGQCCNKNAERAVWKSRRKLNNLH